MFCLLPMRRYLRALDVNLSDRCLDSKARLDGMLDVLRRSFQKNPNMANGTNQAWFAIMEKSCTVPHFSLNSKTYGLSHSYPSKLR